MSQFPKEASSAAVEKPCRACNDFKSWIQGGGPSGTKSDKKGNKSEDTIKVETIFTKANTGQTKPSVSVGVVPDLNSDCLDVDLAIRDQKEGICPPDRLELGSATWTFLHSLAAYYPDNPTPQHKQDALNIINGLTRLYPCAPCAEDLRDDIPKNPPQVSNSREFSEWMCRLHNRVNVKLGKPEFDCSKVFLRWKDGWEDGSCD